MKKLMIPLLALTFFAGPYHLKADCPTPLPGPTGPTGALSDIYISSFSEESSQVIDTSGAPPVLVQFPSNFTGPVGISQPDSSHFIVNKAGTYLVSWMLNTSYNFNTIDAPDIFLFLQVDWTNVIVNPVSNATIEDFNGRFAATNISGQMLLNLAAFANLSMTVQADFDDSGGHEITIDNALFNVVQIATAP
jgi:hypothetical protein